MLFFVPFSGIDFLLSSVTPLLPVWIVGLHKWLSHTEVIADMILLLVTLSCLTTTRATLHNFLELGALPDDLSDIAAWHNGRLLNETLAALQPGRFLKFNHSVCVSAWPPKFYIGSFLRNPQSYISGDTLLLPNMTFYVMGGIFAKDLESVVLQVFKISIFPNSLQFV